MPCTPHGDPRARPAAGAACTESVLPRPVRPRAPPAVRGPGAATAPRRAARGAGRRRAALTAPGRHRHPPSPPSASGCPAALPCPRRGCRAGRGLEGRGRRGPRDHALSARSSRRAKLGWKMNNAGKCAGPPGRVSASGHLFPGAGERRAGFLPPAPSFPRAGTSHRQGWQPRAQLLRGSHPPSPRHPSFGAGGFGAVPLGLAPLLRALSVQGRPSFSLRSSRCSMAPRGCECPIACPAGKGSRAGEVRCSGDNQTGRPARLRLLRNAAVRPLLPRIHSTLHEVPREFAVTFFPKVYFWGEVMFFAEFAL